MTTQAINAPEQLVQQAIDGLLLTSPHLARLDGYPDIKVVINKNHDKSKVAVISGGGSGHEPAHAGYVGDGMLTAAVCGEVFASPSAEAVLSAIRAVTGPAGCLLVVKNYTGDRLHFGLAAEQAKSEGLQVDMVVVGEDVAIHHPGLAGRRGLAGTVLVHKVAGAVASSGATLQQVVEAAQKTADSIATLGVAFSVCTLPGKAPSDRLAPGEMELGLGIHGEPGVEKTKALAAAPLTQRMLTELNASPFFSVKEGDRVVALINNLGATTPLEVCCVTREALTQLSQQVKVSVERCYTGPLMTSLDMAGFSITLMKIQAGTAGDAVLQYLDRPVGAPGWPHTSAVASTQASVVPVPQGASGPAVSATRPTQLSPAGAALEAALSAAATALIEAQQKLDELDSKVGDGDCGETLAHGARAILSDLASKYPLNDAAGTMSAVAASVRHAVGGTSGALYDVALTAAAAALKVSSGDGSASSAQWCAALQAGVQAVAKYGGAKPGSRTMLDALLPAVETLQHAVSTGVSSAESATAAAKAAAQGAQATATMTASAGRASYVPEAVLRSNPDPGAVGVSIWLEAVAGALNAAV